MMQHWFWFGLTIFCVLWYSLLTGYIAFKGAADIRTMLRRLRESNEDSS
jgi:hypothetical protein